MIMNNEKIHHANFFVALPFFHLDSIALTAL
jgi:hypothetical protein